MPKRIGYPQGHPKHNPGNTASKTFSSDSKSVRVKDKEFRFSEFREQQKEKASQLRAKSILKAVRPDAKAEASKKKRATAKKATGK